MQALLLVIGVVFLISTALKSEKKKDVMKHKPMGNGGGFQNPVQNRNVGNHRNSLNNRNRSNNRMKTAGKSILEKAEENTKESKKEVVNSFVEVHRDKEVVCSDNTGTATVYVEKPKEFTEEKKEERKGSQRKKEETEGYHKYGETNFDDFCASDALYLARKDILTGREWL